MTIPGLRLSIVGLVFMLAAPTRADFQAGVEAYKRGDYDTALKEFRPLAEQGDAFVQFNLGVMYIKGQGVLQDYVLAHMWMNLAAAKGVKKAVKGRDLLEKFMNLDQLTEAQRLTWEWKAKGK